MTSFFSLRLGTSLHSITKALVGVCSTFDVPISRFFKLGELKLTFPILFSILLPLYLCAHTRLILSSSS